MKKIIFFALCMLLLSGNIALASDCDISDSSQFIEEYCSLNSTLSSNGLRVMPTVNLSDDILVKYIKSSDVVSFIENGSGVIYFGFPECPWCRSMVTKLFEAASTCNYREPILYANLVDERDTISLSDNRELIVEDPGSDSYHEVVSILYDYLLPYSGLDNPEIHRLYFPMVVYFNEGNIVYSHIDTVPTQSDPYVPLTKEQSEELKAIYCDGFILLAEEQEDI